jgi:hypothetical protein
MAAAAGAVVLLTCLLLLVVHATIELRYTLMWEHHAAKNACTVADIRIGDVVAFASRYPGIVPKAVATFVGSPFFHVGIAVSNGEMLHYIEPNLAWFYRPRRRLCPTGPCFSNISELVEAHSKHTGGVTMLVLRPASKMQDGAIIDAARWVSRCGSHPRNYEDSYIVSYVTRRFHPVIDTLHCNTFVGLLMEQLGRLPISEHPREDYRPGRLLSMLVRRGTFSQITACAQRNASQQM